MDRDPITSTHAHLTIVQISIYSNLHPELFLGLHALNQIWYYIILYIRNPLGFNLGNKLNFIILIITNRSLEWSQLKSSISFRPVRDDRINWFPKFSKVFGRNQSVP